MDPKPVNSSEMAETLIDKMWQDPNPANIERLYGYALREATPEMRREIFEASAKRIQAFRDISAPLDLNAGVIDPDLRVNGKRLFLVSGPKTGYAAVDALPDVRGHIQAGDQVAVKQNADGVPLIVQRIGRYPASKICRVERIIDEGRLVVCDQAGGQQILYIAADLLENPDLGPGVQVRCAPEINLALELENLEPDDRALKLIDNLPDYTLNDLGGLPGVRRQLQRMLALMESPAEDLLDFGLTRSQLALFEGPPGTGKTHAALILASLLKQSHDVAVVLVKGPEFLNPLVGASEAAVRGLFEKLAQLAGRYELVYVIWDEFEALFHSRGRRFSSTIVEDTLVGSFIAEMDGLSKNALENIWFVAISNKPDLLDSAITREGRLGQKVIFTPLQSEPGISEVAAIHLRQRVLDAGLSTQTAAERVAAYAYNGTNGLGLPIALVRMQDGRKELVTSRQLMTGALVKGAVDRAAERAWYRWSNGGPRGISIQDLFVSLDRAVSALPLSRDNLEEYLGWPLDEIARVVEVQRVAPGLY
jgi:ATP-dependent 26S proteasome regulatory subunit